jgi:hypothetical protein
MLITHRGKLLMKIWFSQLQSSVRSAKDRVLWKELEKTLTL